jgi:hypothetical protein
MGRSSEAWSNLTLSRHDLLSQNRRLQEERLGGYPWVHRWPRFSAHHPATVVAACRLHPTVPIAMPDILRGRLALR